LRFSPGERVRGIGAVPNDNRPAAQQRLPSMFGEREGVDAGGLMSYGVSVREMMRRGATYVDKILKGAKPGDLPVEQATKFELIINLKTARALNLSIPATLLATDAAKLK
jgi:putative ABC transport system substrate-binding protein